MDHEDAIAGIAEIFHSYVHPTYNTVMYCTFCDALARQALELLVDEEAAS